MAKPIFIVYMPYKHLNQIKEVIPVLQETLVDYHVLCLAHESESIDFKVFYDKDFTAINYEELKQMIKEKLAL